MMLKNKRIGVAFTGSHCTLENIFPQLHQLVEAGAELYPIMSNALQNTDTRFGNKKKWLDTVEEITGRAPWLTIAEVEPIGPQKLLDLLLIAPCTGNTLAKLAGGVTDTPVLMAAKAHLRNGRPLLLYISTNDGLGINAKNIALLLNTKHVFIVPFGQDNPESKPNSLVSKPDYIMPAVLDAFQEKQTQPILVTYMNR